MFFFSSYINFQMQSRRKNRGQAKGPGELENTFVSKKAISRLLAWRSSVSCNFCFSIGVYKDGSYQDTYIRMLR